MQLDITRLSQTYCVKLNAKSVNNIKCYNQYVSLYVRNYVEGYVPAIYLHLRDYRAHLEPSEKHAGKIC